MAKRSCRTLVGSCRRELLDHIIPLNERHLRRLLRKYVSYYNDDRIHDALSKDAPNGRRMERRPLPVARIISAPRLGAFIIAIAGRSRLRCTSAHATVLGLRLAFWLRTTIACGAMMINVGV
jgi:hypothetical protein